MRIGVIGLGSIGLRHARNLLELGHHVWGYDPDPERLGLFTGFVASSCYYILTETDAVVIASPSPNHFDSLMVAIKKGKPVLVEKPICTKLPDHYSYQHIAKGRVWVGNMLRFHPCVQEAKRWMKDIGKPYRATFMLSQKTEKHAYLTDGVVLNWLSHEVDLALYLLGPDVAGTGMMRVTDDVDDLADIIIRHENGCHSVVHGDFVGEPEQERSFEIVGSQGRITTSLLEGGMFTYPKNRLVTPKVDWDAIYKDEMKAFIEAVEGNPNTDLATGLDGLRTLEVLLRAKEMAGIG